jgi:pimeloyl-ACP methyl ester carboxylesterase
MELMRRRLGPARLIRIPGSGHSVYFERPDEFNRTIENFLREVLA